MSKMGRNRELGIFKLSLVINEYLIETDFLNTRELVTIVNAFIN